MHEALRVATLLAAGVAGGALNAVAGGGSFIAFPALLVLGNVSPVAANATTTVALWPAGLASVFAYRENLPLRRATLGVLAAMSVLGGGLGAKLLLFTSDDTFRRVVPFLMLAAAIVFTYGPRLTKARGATRLSLTMGALIQLAIATYGGYFGGGMGIMMLATFTLMGMTDIHEMNALKVSMGLLINGVALVTFITAGKVVWPSAIPVAVGAVAGGWAGASLARRVATARVRSVVIVIAWTLTVCFAYGALRR